MHAMPNRAFHCQHAVISIGVGACLGLLLSCASPTTSDAPIVGSWALVKRNADTIPGFVDKDNSSKREILHSLLDLRADSTAREAYSIRVYGGGFQPDGYGTYVDTSYGTWTPTGPTSFIVRFSQYMRSDGRLYDNLGSIRGTRLTLQMARDLLEYRR